MERREETGVHFRGHHTFEAIPILRDDLTQLQAESSAKFPELAHIAGKFVDEIQFDVIRDMYRRINARSQGRHVSKNQTDLERAAQKTNEIRREDVFLVARDEKSDNFFAHMTGIMLYSDIPNAIRIDITNELFWNYKSWEK